MTAAAESSGDVRGAGAPRAIVVCADDFGVDPGVSAAIVELATSGRLNATSVMATRVARAPRAEVDALARLAGRISVGLHLDLDALGTRPLPMAWRAWTGGLGGEAMRARIEAQCDAFETALGCAPAHVDGHRHVHQFAGVREALLEVLERRYGARRPRVRSTVPRGWEGPKAQVVAALGGRGLARLLAQRRWPTNPDFRGVHAYREGDGTPAGREAAREAVRARVRVWLSRIADGGELMCHPGDPVLPGEIAGPRRAELDYFASPDWPQDLAGAGVRLAAAAGGAAPFTAA